MSGSLIHWIAISGKIGLTMFELFGSVDNVRLNAMGDVLAMSRRALNPMDGRIQVVAIVMAEDVVHYNRCLSM